MGGGIPCWVNFGRNKRVVVVELWRGNVLDGCYSKCPDGRGTVVGRVLPWWAECGGSGIFAGVGRAVCGGHAMRNGCSIRTTKALTTVFRKEVTLGETGMLWAWAEGGRAGCRRGVWPCGMRSDSD